VSVDNSNDVHIFNMTLQTTAPGQAEGLLIVLLNTTLINIAPEGWGEADAGGAVHFWEYNSHNPDGSPLERAIGLRGHSNSTQSGMPDGLPTIVVPSSCWPAGSRNPRLPEAVLARTPRISDITRHPRGGPATIVLPAWPDGRNIRRHGWRKIT
jgi:hypothetical protein